MFLPSWYVLFCRSAIIELFCLKICVPQIFVFQPQNPNYCKKYVLTQAEMALWIFLNFSFKSRGTIVEICVFQTNFEEPSHFTNKKLQFWAFWSRTRFMYFCILWIESVSIFLLNLLFKCVLGVSFLSSSKPVEMLNKLF